VEVSFHVNNAVDCLLADRGDCEHHRRAAGWFRALGLLGNIIVGLIGIWLMLNVLHFVLPGDPVVAGVPILTSILGAMIIDILLSLLVRGVGPRRSWRRRAL